MKEFEYRVNSYIDSIKYQIQVLNSDSDKNKEELAELNVVLKRIEELYDIYLSKSCAEKRSAQMELLKYVRMPIILGIIHKCRRFVATSLLIAMPLILSSCGKEKELEEETPVLEEEHYDKYYNVEFRDYMGEVIEKQSVISGGNILDVKASKREGYNFLGWYKDGEEFDFKSEITHNIILEEKWEAEKYEDKNEFIKRIKEISDNNDLGIYIASNEEGTLLLANKLKGFIYIADLLRDNMSVLGNINVRIIIDRENVHLIDMMPKEFIYSFSFAGDFSSVSLKDKLKGFKTYEVSLFSRGNINSQDLERFLNVDGLFFSIFSGDFDKFDQLKQLCKINNKGNFAIDLGENVPEVVEIPSYECFIMLKETTQALKVITNSEDVRLLAKNLDTLEIEVKDGCLLSIIFYQSFKDNYDLSSLFAMPIFSQILNVGELNLIFLETSFKGQAEDDKFVIRNSEGIVVGYLFPEGFVEAEHYTRILK